MQGDQKNGTCSYLLPLCCFPSVHWYNLASHPQVWVDTHQNYVKQSLRNRFEILSANGLLSVTIPVVGQKGKKVPLNAIRIAEGKWRSATWVAICSAYGKAAYFEHYSHQLEAIIHGNQNMLCEFNLQALTWSLNVLGHPFNPKFTTTSSLTDQSEVLSDCLEPSFHWPPTPPYLQVFSDRFPFQSNLSILDLIMNQGPASAHFIQQIPCTLPPLSYH